MLAAQRKTDNGANGGTQKRVIFRNILLASDYSASANLAMPYAAGMARSFGGDAVRDARAGADQLCAATGNVAGRWN